jgi:LysM repeat protein
MNIRHSALFIVLSLSPILDAAEPGIVFSGVMTASGKTRIALTDPEKNVTTWVQPGEQFKGYTIARYDEKDEAVFLKKGTQETRIGLVAAKTPDTPASTSTAEIAAATQATAAAIRSNLRQLATAARQYQLAHNVSTVGYNDLVGPGKPIKELKPVAGENYSTLNFGPNVTGVSVTTANGTTISMDVPSANTASTGASAIADSANAATTTAPTGTVATASQPAAQATSTAPTSASVEVLTPTGRQPASPSYTIQGGDTWQKISEMTGVPVSQLKQLNPAILEGSALPAGQTIRVR